MNKAKLTEFCKALSFNTKYEFLEEGKDSEELAKIAAKRGISLPAIDLAIFKGIFAFANTTNLNGCSVPLAEVEKSLHTLAGKAIDFDHIRDRIVGFWLDAEVIGETIYAYGAFFKGNLQKDYELVKELLSKNQLGISFEAYGNREFKDDGSYDLKDIEWAGGGLLINTKPAFPGAGVTEMASRQRVLELASTMTEPTEYIKSAEPKKLEKSRLYTWDMESINRINAEVVCPMCKSVGLIDINVLDFKNNKENATCWMCNCDMNIEMTPRASIVLKDTASRTIKSVTKVEKMEEKSMEKQIGTPSIQEAEALIKDEEQTVVDTKAEVEVASEETIEEVVAKAEAEVKAEVVAAEVVAEVKPAPAQVAEEVASLQKEVATLKAQLSKARDEGKVIGERRSILGEYAKDMSDDDVLDNVKYENATLRKKVAELEGKKSEVVVEKSSAIPAKDVALEIGSKEAKKDTEVETFAKSVRKLAWTV
jgi:hypothetical protein